MRKILDMVRLKVDTGLSDRKVSRSLRVSRSTVSEYVERFDRSGFTWPLSAEADHEALNVHFFGVGSRRQTWAGLFPTGR
jgi:hypothetical protein